MKKRKNSNRNRRVWRICHNPRENDWNDEPTYIAVPYDVVEEKEKSLVVMRAGWHQKNTLAKREFFDTKEACQEEISRRWKEGIFK